MGDVYQYCGDPSDQPLKQGGLPQNLVFQVLVENEDEMLRDLQLSDQGRRISKKDITLNSEQTEYPFTVDSLEPSYAMLQVDATSNVWWPIEIVNPNALLDNASRGVPAVAFRGTKVELSWIPDSGQILVVWYDRTGDDNPTMAGSTELGNLYDSYLKLRTAAQCRELLGLTVGAVLASRIQSSERQWQRFVNKTHQKGKGTKSRVFTPPRYRRGFVDRTRFFVG